MSMTIEAATARLVRELSQAERDVDQAMISLSALLNSMVLARNIPEVAPGTGELAIQHVGKAIEGLMLASREVAKTHGNLRKIYQETSIGDTDECPPDKGALLEPVRVAG